MIELDGTPNKARLGANAILAVSLATAKAAATDLGLPLYRYVGGVFARTLPVPMMNIINGGKHADNPIDIQEFMIMPVAAGTMADAVRIGAEMLRRAEEGAARRRPQHQRRRRGRLRPEHRLAPTRRWASSPRPARPPATGSARTSSSRSTAPRPSSSTSGVYKMDGEGKTFDAGGMVDYLAALCAKWPIVSIEDGMSEDDWAGWKLLTEKLGGKVQLVGDDLFVTNPERLRQGIETGTANSILVKVNQIGTLTETLEAVEMAHRAGYTAVMSHRSGETEDSHHRRPRRGHQLRPDQDRLAVPLRPAGQVQPADPHRAAARHRRPLRRPDHPAPLSQPARLAEKCAAPRSVLARTRRHSASRGRRPRPPGRAAFTRAGGPLPMDHDSLGRRLRRWLKDAAPPVGLALLCGYFVWHSLEGESGLWARERRLAEIAGAR